MTRHQFMDLTEYAPVSVTTGQEKSDGSWACTAGFQRETPDGTRRWVTAAFRYGGSRYDDTAYASVALTPDEARGLAARLLDAADAADEQRYTLTPKGEAALV